MKAWYISARLFVIGAVSVAVDIWPAAVEFCCWARWLAPKHPFDQIRTLPPYLIFYLCAIRE